ncbi:MAG: hypothetical protein ACLFR1_16375 [Spirochaetia bacterium]
MNTNHIQVLFLIGRPAAGKSEVIKYLKDTEEDQRVKRFGIAPFIEIDDFPMLWAWFEEDKILEEMGYPRLHTDSQGFFSHQYLWDLLIRRLDLEYRKLVIDKPKTSENKTIIIEFSRGAEHGGFSGAFQHFSTELLKKGAVLYIDVPFEESLRKNRKRANPDKPHSILEHSLPDDKLKKLYGESDWQEFSRGDDRFLHIQGVKIPYAVFPNEDDVTTPGGAALGDRLEECLKTLQERIEKR